LSQKQIVTDYMTKLVGPLISVHWNVNRAANKSCNLVNL